MAEPISPSESELFLRRNHIPAGILRSAVKFGRISNAYLLKGPEGAPKDALAHHFAKTLLCDSASASLTGEPCGTCWSCRSVSNQGHPDLVEVAKEGNAIKIKASHEMIREAMARPYHSKRKVFIVKDAEDMTVEASNALLKLLEEPPAYVTFVLTATNVRGIPDTIVSRCQAVPFRKLPADALVEILVSHHGAAPDDAAAAASHADGDLGRALRILSGSGEAAGQGVLNEVTRVSPVELALKYAKAEPSRRVDVLTDLEIELVKRLRAKTSQRADDWAEARRPETELGGLYRSVRSLQKAKARLRSNVNPFLTFAVLFMDLSRAQKEGE